MSEKLVVGVYHSPKMAERAIVELEKHGFPTGQISVVAEDFENEAKLSSRWREANRVTPDLKKWFGEHFARILSRSPFTADEKHFHARKYFLIAHGTPVQITRTWAISRETN